MKCPNCGGRGGWEDPEEGQWVTCVRCGATGEIWAEKTPIAPQPTITVRLEYEEDKATGDVRIVQK